MFRSLQMIFMPGAAWGRIAASPRSFFAIFFLSLIPLIVVTSVADIYAFQLWGWRIAFGGNAVHYDFNRILRFEIIQSLTSILMVLTGTVLVQWIAESFTLRTTFTACFNLAVYGFSPLFWARILNVIPPLDIWMTMGLGMVGIIFVLYQGVGVVLQPEQTKGFGLYILIALSFTLLSAMAQLVSQMPLRGL